jgi:ligand-binding sensor domain-containing protein
MKMPYRPYLLALRCWMLLASTAVAQTDYWQAAPGPYGGTSITDFLVLPQGEVYAASSSGIFFSDDDGVTWSTRSDGLTNFDIRDLHVLADGRLIAATYGSGLFSFDSGAGSWVAAGLERTYTTSIIEPSSGHILVGSNGFVYDSVDNGQTWKARSLDGFQVNVQALSFNADYLFAGSTLGVFRSARQGTSWEFASYGLEEYNILSLAADNSGAVYAGASPKNGGCALYRSRGNGNIWTCIQPASDPVVVPFMQVDTTGKLWAGAFQRLFSTEDQGSSWSARPASKSSVGALALTGSSMLIGTAGLGVFRSTKAGSTWKESNVGLISKIQSVTLAAPGRVLVGTEGGLFESTFFGNEWSRVNPDSPLIQRVTDALVDAQGRIVAATTGGVWRHTEGAGWEALGPPGMPSIRDLTMQADGSIIAAYHAGLYVFGGSTWTAMPISGSDQSSRDVAAVAVTETGTILAGAAWDSWKKAPGIGPWELMSAGSVPWFDIQSFGVSGDQVLAGTRYLGVLESRDDGSTWKTVGTGLNGTEDIRDIEFDSRQRAHIATYGSGVFQMNPWTKVWLPMNRGLESHLRVTSLAFDSNGNGYAGTLDGGLYRHIISTSTASEVTSEVPGALTLGKPFPNPVRGQITLPVQQNVAGETTIEVFDILGRRVNSTTVFQPASSWEYSFDTSILESGFYLIGVQSQGRMENSSFVVMN